MLIKPVERKAGEIRVPILAKFRQTEWPGQSKYG